MRIRFNVAWMAVITIGFSGMSAGQDSQPPSPMQVTETQAIAYPRQSAAPEASSELTQPEAKAPEWGGYEVHFAAEVGGRAIDRSGNASMYSTYVNLGSGMRLLDTTLDMHSPSHTGLLFDDLTMSSFGYGGDPNYATHLRMQKGGAYNFVGSFRGDKNYWDYNLLANPLNPQTQPVHLLVAQSPHLLDLARKMTDLDLELLPQSKIRFDLGYSHNNNNGPSFTTYHQGTEALLFQQWRDLSNTFHAGVTILPAPRTRIAFDEYYTHVKSDTSASLNGTPNVLANGTPADIGITVDPANNSPCSTPFTSTGAVTPTCNLFTGLTSNAPYRTSIPTEQLSFQSSYWRALDLNGRVSYTGASGTIPFTNFVFNGFESRTHATNNTLNVVGKTQNITVSADVGISYQITPKLTVNDSFRWNDFRIPTVGTLNASALFSPSATVAANAFSATTCPPPFTGAGCPQHAAASGADLTTTLHNYSLGQNLKTNVIELQYDFNEHAGAFIGYRFERRTILQTATDTTNATFFPTVVSRGGCTLLTNGVCMTSTTDTGTDLFQINDHGALFGVWLRPSKALRINADVELHSADNVFTNIEPRHAQSYKAKATYRPRNWLTFGGALRIHELRNLADGLGNKQHNHSFSFNSVVAPNPRLAFDLSYSYDDLLSNINVCFVETPAPSFASNSALCGPSYLTAVSFYHDVDHFGSGNVMFRPLRRATVTMGYTISSTSGSALSLNPLNPVGPLSYNYHLPSASLSFDITPHVTFKTGWNYYDYNEKSQAGPTLPRDFRANALTTSLRYSR